MSCGEESLSICTLKSIWLNYKLYMFFLSCELVCSILESNIFVTVSRYKASSAKGAGVQSESGDLPQASQMLLLEPRRTRSIPPALGCDSTCQTFAREVHRALVPGIY